FEPLARYRLTDENEIALRDKLKTFRENYKGLVADIQKLLPSDAAQSITDLESMQPALRGLSQLAERMHEAFLQRKKERNLLDFSDLEHMALEILQQPELQAAISARFDAIFVDEYQDISGIQEAILQAVSRPSAEGSLPFLRFYVGDVKQSIYRFRQADPFLFMGKLANFSSDPAAPLRKISLNQNFRSRESVLNAVNRVFAHVMRADITEIAYDEDARLYPGAPSAGDERTELHIIGGKGLRAADHPRLEASVIAGEINRLVGSLHSGHGGESGKHYQYRDIAILLPKAKGVANTVERGRCLDG
ncbi:MAG: UvrD-helicase domain-containing protein, partial [Kiritimatiellaeota bacterium]|nr:UvrD-helicase domain-containing protein [Kiritimatiellota bacterium]